jgi:hypothetical protein
MSDRTNYTYLDSARVASNQDISNALAVAAKVHQRFLENTLQAASNANVSFYVALPDRNVNVISGVFSAAAAVASSSSTYTVINLIAVPSGASNLSPLGGNAVTLGTFNTGNTALVAFTSQSLTLSNTSVAANGSLYWNFATTGNANTIAIPAGSLFQVIWQEV